MIRQSILPAMISACILLSGCTPDKVEQLHSTSHSIPNVSAVIVEPHSQTLTMMLPGRSSAFKEAEVRPQVNGIISQRNFEEGGLVTKDQSLYQIDDSTFKTDLVSAQADLRRAQASVKATGATAKRYRALLEQNSISQQQLDDAEAAYEEAQADVIEAKANINTAKINLEYAKVTAPINGIVGKSNVTEGALVTANQSEPLTTIQQLDPMYIDIVQSSAQLLRLKRARASGQLEQDDSAAVMLTLEDGSTYPQKGQLKFTEVSVDESTGSVLLRAQFSNPDGILLPGMFVRANVIIGVDPDAILVPQSAVSRDVTGAASVLVVNDKKIVEKKPVQTAESIGNQWRIEQGLDAGDKVITSGFQKIQPGDRVNIDFLVDQADSQEA